MEQLAKLAAERDGQLKQDTTTEDWRDLFDRARCLFREAALPNNVSRLLTRIFSIHPVPGNHCESVIAWVLVKAQKQGYEAALQELESLGISAPPPPKRS